MIRPLTREDYENRIHRVIRFLSDHAEEELTTERLADVACFSPYHFHRIYRGLMGETVMETVRRIRLHRAAVSLLRREASMPQVARRAGYGSVAAFTRSFTAAYGMPPAAYRDQGGLVPYHLRTPDEETIMSYPVSIRTCDPARLFCLPHQGDYHQIGAVFDQLFSWAGPRGLVGPQTRSIGIYYDDPAVVPVEALRSQAALTVPPDAVAEGRIETVTLPGGRYAVLRHKGPYAELPQAYHWLLGSWLPGSGEEAASLPCFEEYLNDPSQVAPSDLLTDVHLPLKG